MSHAESDSSFAVLRVFTIPPEDRQRTVDKVRVFATAEAHLQPGICSFEMFTDEGQQHILTLVRWKDRESFEAYKSSAEGARAFELARMLTPTVFFLRPEAAVTSTFSELARSAR